MKQAALGFCNVLALMLFEDFGKYRDGVRLDMYNKIVILSMSDKCTPFKISSFKPPFM